MGASGRAARGPQHGAPTPGLATPSPPASAGGADGGGRGGSDSCGSDATASVRTPQGDYTLVCSNRSQQFTDQQWADLAAVLLDDNNNSILI